MRPLPAALALVALVQPLLVGVARADPLKVGSVVPELTFEDQFGASHTLTDALKLVLFARDMDGGELVREALATDGGPLLESSAAAFVSDVHRMPGLIRRLVAKPRMRGRGYPMWLDESGELTADFPAADGKVTLLVLEARRVVRIDQLGDSAAIRTALGAPPAEPGPDH